MGITKSDLFTEEQNHLASIFKALGHPARVAIVEQLLSQEDCICNDIVESLPLSQSTISQHLKALKEAEIIQGNLKGNTICYGLDPRHFGLIQEVINSIQLKFSDKNSDCCKTN